MRIFKYQLDFTESNQCTIQIPGGYWQSNFMNLEWHYLEWRLGRPMVVVLSDPDRALEPVTFALYHSGEDVSADYEEYVGCADDGREGYIFILDARPPRVLTNTL